MLSQTTTAVLQSDLLGELLKVTQFFGCTFFQTHNTVITHH